MPYKVVVPKTLRPEQKRFSKVYYEPCPCGGEKRIYITGCGLRGDLCILRCRNCRNKQKIKTPPHEWVRVADLPQLASSMQDLDI